MTAFASGSSATLRRRLNAGSSTLPAVPDSGAFEVSAALAKGWQLHGGPTMAFDPVKGVMRCGQAVTKEVASDYTADMKLGEQ